MDLDKWDTRCGIGVLDNPQIFHRLMDDQQTFRFWDVTFPFSFYYFILLMLKIASFLLSFMDNRTHNRKSYYILIMYMFSYKLL